MITNRKSLAARCLCLLLALAGATSAPCQEASGEPYRAASTTQPSDSLVLVLNIISSTHARPMTGVVLAQQGERGSALVLVPAKFVSAGDEIIVLDGGTDILRNGRATRTVGRSVESGLALLEVDGLERQGAEISSDGWPAGAAELEFIAWPAARALAEGAPLGKSTHRLVADDGGAIVAVEPQLSGVAGPFFDHCGRLAAYTVADEAENVIGSDGLRAFAESAGYELVAASCGFSPTEATLEEDSTVETVDPPRADTSGQPETDTQAERSPAEGTPEEPEEGANGFLWLGAFLALLVLGVFMLRRLGRSRGSQIILQGKDASGRAVVHRLEFAHGSTHVVLERDAGSVVFTIRNAQVLMSDTGDESGPVVLALEGTPCLPGEHFVILDGQRVQLADEEYMVQLDLLEFETAS